MKYGGSSNYTSQTYNCKNLTLKFLKLFKLDLIIEIGTINDKNWISKFMQMLKVIQLFKFEC